MTDNEIIKALECLAGKDVYCSKCAYNGMSHCREKVGKNALALINRQKAEIERLKEHTEEGLILAKQIPEMITLSQSEAIKDFAERLKKSAFECDVSFGYGREHYTEAVTVIEIDRLVKEKMEG